jgi:hypothetical protein
MTDVQETRKNLKIISFNVAGWTTTIERIKKNHGSLKNWLSKHDVDILCLQGMHRCRSSFSLSQTLLSLYTTPLSPQSSPLSLPPSLSHTHTHTQTHTHTHKHRGQSLLRGVKPQSAQPRRTRGQLRHILGLAPFGWRLGPAKGPKRRGHFRALWSDPSSYRHCLRG